jgi:hypothetical protein
LVRSLIAPKPLALATVSALATWAAFGCSRVPGEPDPDPAPWNADDIALGRCVQTCMPDWGPRPITMEECARVEEGLEFFPVPVWDWETANGEVNAYSYQDGTTEFLSTNTPTCTVEDHANYSSEGNNCQASYAPTPAPVDRCGSTQALHVRGGPFREWGGGLGKRLDGVADAAAGITCPKPPPATPDPTLPAVCPELDPEVADVEGKVIPATDTQPEGLFAFPTTQYYQMMVDLREWDGIAFWARRGPDSQPGFRIALGDRNTDDDVSMLATAGGVTNPRCRRAKECDCRNHRPCTQAPDGQYYCWDPRLDADYRDQKHPWNHEAYRCNFTQCNYRYAAYENVPDWPFLTPETSSSTYRPAATASCNTYTFKNDITRDYCFDKDGPFPPEGSDRCGDPWFAPVRLSTDWEFFRVPFSELRQEGYGKEFPAIDLSAVTMVRFTWAQGWVDYWIDDVRFYRKR